MKLSDYLCEDGILMDLTGGNKKEIIHNLVRLLTNTVEIKDTNDIVHKLEEREELKTTGIGSGIAIPHCKSGEMTDVQIVVGISKEGIDFESLDNKPAHFFFLLVAPEKGGAEHLKASAKIVRLFREDSFRESLLSMNKPSEVLAFIEENE
ncbi:MAG: PTS sugar transporter subunit IIA [Proteobacteria bacterium]|nr:PTS sugar transporter subunit IIA [Pseudomonadota bacterium]